MKKGNNPLLAEVRNLLVGTTSRVATIDRAGIDAKSREITISLQDSKPPSRGAVFRLAALRAGRIVFVKRSDGALLGIAKDPFIKNGKLLITVKISRSAVAEEVWGDIVAGIVQKVLVACKPTGTGYEPKIILLSAEQPDVADLGNDMLFRGSSNPTPCWL
jgi:hypothetical protein